MRAFLGAAVLSLTLAAAPTYAQTPAPAAPGPAGAAGQTAPAQPSAPAPEAKFQDGLKYAYVRVDRIASESSEGKAAAAKIKGLQEQKVKELKQKNDALQAAQQKLEQGGTVMSDQARAQLQTEIERQQRDIQRFTEDAQQDVTQLTQQVEDEFQRKLNPIIDKVAREKQVHFVFNAMQSGLVWADPGMDLTVDVIRAFDAAAGSAAKPPAPAATQK